MPIYLDPISPDGETPLTFPIDGCYFQSVEDADTLADTLSGLSSYKAASEGAKGRALVAASLDVDRAMRYQGRKYDPTQILEFPRVAYTSSDGYGGVTLQAATLQAVQGGDVVWDWDLDDNVAIVPPNVLKAVLYQADSILTGDRDGRLQAIADGVASQQIGSASESYFKAASSAGPSPLAQQANRIMEFYRIRQGSVL
jgi:hypothetical protein